MTEPRAAVGDKPNQPKLSDRTLKRFVKWGSAALVLLVVVFSVVYYLGQHVNAGPSLADRAVTTAEAAVKAQPNNIAVRLALAQAYLQDKRTDQALSQFNQVLKAVPNNVASLQGRATIYLKQGKLDAARADFQAIITLAAKGEFAGADPVVEAAHYFLAVIASDKKDFVTAAGQLKAALSMDSTDSDAWYLTGQVALKQSAPKSAVVAFTKAISFVPTGWCDPYPGLIDSYSQLKDPTQVTYYTALNAMCQHRTGEAKKLLSTLTTSPLAADALLQLGGLAQAQGDTSTAKSMYQRALSIAPNNPIAKAALAALSAGPSASTGK
jgi:Tfp pilus assembly protein PilF